MDGTSISISSISIITGKHKKNQSPNKVRVNYDTIDLLSLAPPSPRLLTPSFILLFVDFPGVQEITPSYPILPYLLRSDHVLSWFGDNGRQL